MNKLYVTLILLCFIYCKNKGKELKDVSIIGTENQLVNQVLVSDIDTQISNANNSEPKAESSNKLVQNNKQKLRNESIADSLYKRKLSVGVDTSIHKSKSCEDILQEFQIIAEQVIKEKDLKVFTAKGWNKNDQIFESCLRSNEAFKKVYYEYNQRIKAILK